MRRQRFARGKLSTFLALLCLQLPASLLQMKLKPPLDCNTSEAHQISWYNLHTSTKLHTFDIQTSKLVEFSEDFVLPASVVELNLSRCKRLPKKFGHLTDLTCLELDGCTELDTLPQEFGELRPLKHLSMRQCRKLTALPKEFGLLTSLQVLNLDGCRLLKTLPDRFGRLRSLTWLSMRRCENLNALPNDFGQLISLERLFLSKSVHLKRLLASLVALPETIEDLSSLTYLRLESCIVKSIPSGFRQLRLLKKMEIEDCPRLENLPEGFHYLPLEMLQLLNYSSRWIWESEEFKMSDCIRMEGTEMKKVVKLRSLYLLNIKGSVNLEKKWKEMQEAREEYPLVVTTSEEWKNGEEEEKMLQPKASLKKLKTVYIYVEINPHSHELEGIHQILNSLPEGISFRIPYNHIRARSLFEGAFPANNLHPYEPILANVVVDPEGRKRLQRRFGKEDISETSTDMHDGCSEKFCCKEDSNEIWKFLKSILQDRNSTNGSESPDQSLLQNGEEANKFGQFVELLERNDIHHFIAKNGTEVEFSDGKGKVIAILVCNLKIIKQFGQTYEDLQSKYSNFKGIWIPIETGDYDYGFGAYARVRESLQWLTLPDPTLLNVEHNGWHVIVFDEKGSFLPPNFCF
eukprot:Gb_01236 [translate_table: standard]